MVKTINLYSGRMCTMNVHLSKIIGKLGGLLLIWLRSSSFSPSEIHGQGSKIIEFSLITATFWIPHTSFYVQD